MTQKPFLHAAFLHELEQFIASGVRPASWSPTLAGIVLGGNDDTRPSPTAVHLIALLHARQAVLKAAFDTAQVADELRRYQKFAKPGRPSPHIVQLRQQQAAARQASSQSRQLLIQSAAAFVRAAGIVTPARQTLEVFIEGWMDASLPQDGSEPDAGASG